MNRKFFATLFMLLLVITGAFSPVLSLFSFGPVNHVYAQVPPTTPTPATPPTTPTPPTTDAAPATPTEKEEIECGTNFICGIVVIISYTVQFVPNLIAQVTGMVLDYTLWKNLQSETWTAQDTADSFVVKGWKLARDFSNLFFIFALFVVAFSLILSSAGTDQRPLFGLEPKRTIARIILIALLINFSFFMCRFIIDVTNLFAGVFYEGIVLVEGDTSNPSQSQVSSSASIDSGMGSSAAFYSNLSGVRSVSLAILANIDPQTMMLNAQGSGFQETSGFMGKLVGWKSYDSSVYITLLFVSFMVGIFNFFLIYLFVSSSIFLFSRIYGLYFLIILSPIAFVSTTIPQLQKKEYFGFDDWFKQLVGLAFSLPIYMFFLWLALFFLKAGNSFSEAPTEISYVMVASIIIVKLFAMGIVLIFGKKVAQDMSGKIGAMATGAVTGLVSGAAMVAGAAMTGGASAALRTGGGLARNALTNAATRTGEVVAGKENVEAIRQRFASGNFKSFDRLNNFNPIKGMGGKTMGERAVQLGRNFGDSLDEAARISGSNVSLKGTLGSNFKEGETVGEGMKRKRAEEKERKQKEFEANNRKFEKQANDAKIEDLTAKLNDTKTPETQKGTIKSQIAVLKGRNEALERQNLAAQAAPQNPATPGSTNTGTAPQNGATPGAQGATGGNGSNTGANPTGTNTSGTSNTSQPLKNISVKTEDGKDAAISKEQNEELAQAIGKELKDVVAELNNPANKSKPEKMDELRAKYNQLSKEEEDLASGKIASPRLKTIQQKEQAQQRTAELKQIQTSNSSFAGRSLGDGKGETQTYTRKQQDRILEKAIAKEARIEKKEAAAAKNASRAASLLSGISSGTPTSGTTSTTTTTVTTAPAVTPTPVPESADFDNSGLINTPDTMDFGGIQTPESS